MQVELPLSYETLSDGTEVGKFESISFICKDGIPISPPFSEITPIENGYTAYFGRDVYKLDRNGRIVSGPDYPNSFTDFAKDISNNLVERYLELARDELLKVLDTSGSQLRYNIDRTARISARYWHGSG